VEVGLARSTRRSFRSREGTPMRCDGRRGALLLEEMSAVRDCKLVSACDRCCELDGGLPSIISICIACSAICECFAE
jgi:hypothetical protein